jgi:RNA polymerase sigma-70 factor (ECF subfamily)
MRRTPQAVPVEDRQGRSEREKDLLTRAAGGDAAAVRDVFRTHVERLHRHVARLLGPGDPDVEDVVQQTFLAALDGAYGFDGRSTLSTWLFGIATRRALDAARSRWRRQRWSRAVEAVGLGTAHVGPERAYEAHTDAQAILDKLPPDLRLVFVMHDVEGYTFAEISGVTETGISTLHGRLIAARKKIESLVGGAHG